MVDVTESHWRSSEHSQPSSISRPTAEQQHNANMVVKPNRPLQSLLQNAQQTHVLTTFSLRLTTELLGLPRTNGQVLAPRHSAMKTLTWFRIGMVRPGCSGRET